MAITREAFGKNLFGEEVELFTLTNGAGLTARIMNHGGTILSLNVPDRDGNFADVVLGHDSAAEYEDGGPYFGCLVGRFANRIKEGAFTLDGTEYSLPINNGPNALHGGLRGFDKKIWSGEILASENAVRLHCVCADGEEGYPGELQVTVTYTLSEENELILDYRAETDKATPLNMTNHSYFNLAGHDSGYIGNQVMMVNADAFLPTDAMNIPYGEERSVEGTPFDFRQPVTLGARIDADDEQIRFGAGYDHNYCLNKKESGELSLAARAEDPQSGRMMEVFTTEPGVQLYTANYLDGSLSGKGGFNYERRNAFCLETQHYPDSPNQSQFPNTILQPGDTFTSRTVFKFGVV